MGKTFKFESSMMNKTKVTLCALFC